MRSLECYFGINPARCFANRDKNPNNSPLVAKQFITCQVSRRVMYCDVIRNRLWRYQQNVNTASETRNRCVRTVFLSLAMSSLCCVRNEKIYELSWRTVSIIHSREFILMLTCWTNSRMTLAWPHEQFGTLANTLCLFCTTITVSMAVADGLTLGARTVANITPRGIYQEFPGIMLVVFVGRFPKTVF